MPLYPQGPARACVAGADDTDSAFFGTFADESCPVVPTAGAPLLALFYTLACVGIAATLAFGAYRRQPKVQSGELNAGRRRRRSQVDPSIEMRGGTRLLTAPGAVAGEQVRVSALLKEDKLRRSFFIDFGEGLEAQCYRQDYAGVAALGVVAAFYFMWVALYVIVIAGYYWQCEFKGFNNMCFYGSYPVFGNYARNSTAFFVVWCCSLLSYGSMVRIGRVGGATAGHHGPLWLHPKA